MLSIRTWGENNRITISKILDVIYALIPTSHYEEPNLLGSIMFHSCHAVCSRSSISPMIQHYKVHPEYFSLVIDTTPLTIKNEKEH